MSWIDDLPKVELHLHLEGAIPLDTLWTLVRKYGKEGTVRGIEQLREMFSYRDFPHFLEVWQWKNQFIREPEDFTLIAEAFANQLAVQNIVYAEAFFSPTDFRSTGMSIGEIASAIRTGLDRTDSTRINLIADLVRDNGPEKAVKILDEVKEARECGIVGIGIGGSEHHHPAADFGEVFEQARQFDFHTTAHAGEASGAKSVADAINVLQCERVGHGTRAIEDEPTMALILEKSVHVEACPNSNLMTGVVENIGAHPIREFFDRGLSVSVNTDDPVMFNSTLADELNLLAHHLEFTREDMKQLMRNAIDSAFCTNDEKAQVSALIDDYTAVALDGGVL